MELLLLKRHDLYALAWVEALVEVALGCSVHLRLQVLSVFVASISWISNARATARAVLSSPSSPRARAQGIPARGPIAVST